MCTVLQALLGFTGSPFCFADLDWPRSEVLVGGGMLVTQAGLLDFLPPKNQISHESLDDIARINQQEHDGPVRYQSTTTSQVTLEKTAPGAASLGKGVQFHVITPQI